MTAVFSIAYIPNAQDCNIFCFEHHETISTEQSRGALKTEEWCDYLAHELCDPRPDDDPNLIRLMRRGIPPPNATVIFEFFVTPVQTKYGVGFVADYRQGRSQLCPPAVTQAGMRIYADVRRWVKLRNSLLDKAAIKQLRIWHDKLFAAPDITYNQDDLDYNATPDPVAELLGKEEKA